MRAVNLVRGSLVWGTATPGDVGAIVEQPGSEQPVGDPLPRGRFQFVPQRALAQCGTGPEQALDYGQRTGDIAVAQSFPDPDETIRMPMRPVDGLQAGQWRAGQGGEQFLATDLDRVVIQRRQHAVEQTDSVPFTSAVHQVWLHSTCVAGSFDAWAVRCEGRRDQWMQPVGRDGTGPEQFQIGEHPGRRVRKDR